MGHAEPPVGMVSRRGWTVGLAFLVAVVAGVSFAYRLDDEPIFVDEAAFLSQAYFGDLFFAARWSSPLWLEYAAYDLPPLPKYLINVSLRLHGFARPAREWAIRWYDNSGEARFVTPDNLRAARWPSVLMGTAGCVALFLIGTHCGDRRIGLLAALLLAINPLYALHARRAMADVPAEALVLATAAAGLGLVWMLRREHLGTARLVGVSCLVGLLGGLAVLAKLNGGLGLLLVCSWMIFAGASSATARRRMPLAFACVGLMALVAFVALNPFVTARPTRPGSVLLMMPKPADQTVPVRLGEVIEHRLDVSRTGQRSFPRDALPTLDKKAAVLVVQGFGRFGPFGPRRSDSTQRYAWAQDWGAIAWLPLVLAGFAAWPAIGAAQKRRGASSSWASVPLGFIVCVATVGAFLPMAWDRYLLPIQAFSTLMAAGVVVSTFDRMARRGGPA